MILEFILYSYYIDVTLHVNIWFIFSVISEVISLLMKKNKGFSAVIYSHSLVFKNSLSVFSLVFLNCSLISTFLPSASLRFKVPIDFPAEGLLVTCSCVNLKETSISLRKLQGKYLYKIIQLVAANTQTSSMPGSDCSLSLNAFPNLIAHPLG